MSEEPRPGEASAKPQWGGRGDIGRRVAQRRAELGLSLEEVAVRAGAAPGYLRYLEENPATPGIGLLLRLAAALDSTVAELSGGGTELPQGATRAAPRPQLLELTREECFAHLSTHGVGRVAVVTPEGPAIVPVNYTVVDNDIVYRTKQGTVPAAVRSVAVEVAFEVDHIDEALSEGWSVLVVGPGRQITDPAELERLAGIARSKPWAGGERDLWVSIEPTRITGRRIRRG